MPLNQIPRIKYITEIKLVGVRTQMTLAEDKTAVLWQKFMPKRNKITNRVNSDLFDIQIYDPEKDFKNFDSNTEFEKWSAAEVSNHDHIVEGMESLIIPEGKYAVFNHRGSASEARQIFQYIYGVWLPGSGYNLDNRPHFQILKEGYRPDNPQLEESVWIPLV